MATQFKSVVSSQSQLLPAEMQAEGLPDTASLPAAGWKVPAIPTLRRLGASWCSLDSGMALPWERCGQGAQECTDLTSLLDNFPVMGRGAPTMSLRCPPQQNNQETVCLPWG